jgi:Predicted transcriptional regulators
MNRLKEARKAKGLTQVEVAKYIGIGQGGYSCWENGINRIDNVSLARLSELFGVSVDYLLGNDSPEPLPTSPNGVMEAGLSITARSTIGISPVGTGQTFRRRTLKSTCSKTLMTSFGRCKSKALRRAQRQPFRAIRLKSQSFGTNWTG